MSQVTDPILLDRTGQDISAKLQAIADAINGGTIDPLTVTQNGTYTPSGTTLGYGPVTVSVGGGGAILSGPTAPASSQGANGNIYLQYYQSALPSGYTALDYIYNASAGAYINTGYLFKASSRLEMDCNLQAGSSTYPTPFGTRVNQSNDPRQWYLSIASNGIYYAMGAQEYFNSGETFPFGQDVAVIAQKESATVRASGGDVTITTNPQTNVALYPLYLWTANMANSPWSYGWAIGKVYGAKLYEDNTLVMDLRPALNSSDVAGLYDLIGNQFYPSAGAVQFSAGTAYTDGAVIHTYAKVGGAWQDLIGTDIADIGT